MLSQLKQPGTTQHGWRNWGIRPKLVKPWFSVVVYRVPTEDFALDREKQEGIEKIMGENDLAEKGFQIKDIAWLKKDRPLGRSASMGIWLNIPEAAESIINNGCCHIPKPGSQDDGLWPG